MTWDDYADEEWVDDDGEDDADADLQQCPSCNQAVHEETQQCPHCGDWIVPVSPGGRSRGVFLTIVTILLIGGFLLVVLR